MIKDECYETDWDDSYYIWYLSNVKYVGSYD